jgi:hypothetical protein
VLAWLTNALVRDAGIWLLVLLRPFEGTAAQGSSLSAEEMDFAGFPEPRANVGSCPKRAGLLRQELRTIRRDLRAA